MELKNSDALSAFAVLVELVDREEIPFKPSYWIGRAVAQIEPEIRKFEDDRIKLIKKHSELDEDGNPISENDHYKIADKEGFAEEYQWLLDRTFEIKYEPISIDDFGDVAITPRKVMALGRLIKENNEE